MDFANIEFDFLNTTPTSTTKNNDDKKKSHRRSTVCTEMSLEYEYRRAFSEQKLIEAMGGFKTLEENHCYNFITAGDVDSLSFLQLILHYQKLDYCLFSTWCMCAEDILKFDQWLTDGIIKKLDAYIGEIFPSSYSVEWKMLNEIFKKHDCGRIAVFKNHSKIYAGYGEKFYFGIQTSANINTNPRTENGCIIINEHIFRFYKEYFDGINSFIDKQK